MKKSVSEFVTLQGIRHHVRTWGEPDAPLLMFLHGWGDISASWQFIVDALQQDWRILAPDWRGCGLSEWVNRAYYFPDYLLDMDALVEHYSPGKPVSLVTHSMGANVACLYAGIRPDRVAKLVNLEGMGLPQRSADDAPRTFLKWLDQMRIAPTFRHYNNREELAERLRKDNPRLTPERASFLSMHLGLDDPKGGISTGLDPYHRYLNPVLYRVDEAKACWRRVTAPVLSVTAEQSVLFQTFFTPESEDYRSRIACFPNIREVRLEDCGHNMHHDQPERLAQLIEEFLC